MVAKCEHEPVEQVRKAMGPGDYFDVIINSMDESRWVRELPTDMHGQLAAHLLATSEVHNDVELGPHNETDMRIVCRHCFLSTGWMKADVPGLPAGAGIPFVRAKWDEIKQYDAEEWNAVLRSRGQRTKIMSFGS